MNFHIYGQLGVVKLPPGATVSDLKSLAYFNRIIRNYQKMKIIERRK